MTAPTPEPLAALRAVPYFEGVALEHLRWLVETAEARRRAAGEVIVEPGSMADEMVVLLRGAVEVRVEIGGQMIPFGTFSAGSVLGVLPYSRMTVYPGRAIAIEDSLLLMLHRRHFAEFQTRMPDVVGRLVALMSDRVRESTRQAEQREKMAALGKLSAGLAHELNNPAAAVRRAAAELRDRLRAMPDLAVRVATHRVPEEVLRSADHVRERIDPPEPLAALDRSEKEDAIAEWLEDQGVEDAYLLAATFVDNGMTISCLDEIAGGLPAGALPDVLRWIESTLAAEALTGEIESAAGRIGELVASVKTYTHMDQAQDKQPVDVRDGLDSTLVMLGHKIKKKTLFVERDYEDGLPRATGLPGELNQVWTNLIDNAIDAMDDGGKLGVRARRERDCLLVEIADDGHGIPPAIRNRIFEPFFTTKEVGAGTGLGLDVVHRIVTRRHGGRIAVESAPGRTVFSVRLPLAG